MTRELLGERLGVEWRRGRTAATRHRHKRVDRATAAKAADLVEPFGLKRIAGLTRVQQDRAARHQIPRLHESRRQAFHQRNFAGDEYPSFVRAPAPAVAVAQSIAKRSGPLGLSR